MRLHSRHFKLQNQPDDKKFVEAIGPVLRSAQKLLTMPPFSTQLEDYKKKFDSKDLYEKEDVNDNSGWNKFLKGLGRFKVR